MNRFAIVCLSAVVCAAGLVHAATSATEANYPQVEYNSDEATHDYASWAADPTVAGPDLPPTGRSLFDFVFTENEGDSKVYRVPFPFSALINQIRTHLDHRQIMGGTRVAIIPMGRSLQRVAAAPEFFESPRTVVAVTGEPDPDMQDGGMVLKDRLYVAYVEKTDSLEVISYNETAGRFEFQLVKDYRAGAKPKVFYADRAICISCHQNHAPIFPRAMWRETNANGVVAHKLREAGTSMRLTTQANNGFPDNIERAAIRANDLVMLQTTWQAGCEDDGDSARSRNCRATAFTSVVQYGLSGKRGFDWNESRYLTDFVATLSRNWTHKWPQGLRVGRSSISDRNPFDDVGPDESTYDWKAAVHIPPNLDPLTPRPPHETVLVANSKDTRRMIYGWSNAFAVEDFRTVDRLLLNSAANTSVQKTVFRAQCTAKRAYAGARLKLSCASKPGSEHPVSLAGHVEDGKKIHLEEMDFGQSGTLGNIEVNDDRVQSTDGGYALPDMANRSASSTRLHDGRRLTSVKIHWNTDGINDETNQLMTARFEAEVVDDFVLVRQAIDRMLKQNPALFESAPLMRARLMPALLAQLGSHNSPMPANSASAHDEHNTDWCCIDDVGMPTAMRDAPEVDAAVMGNEQLRPFIRYCGTCHLTAEQFPPNFLSGTAEQVARNLRRCAPRMLVRLSAWGKPESRRAKSPMPPTTALPALGTSEHQWATSQELEQLRTYLETLLQAPEQRAQVTAAAGEAYEGLPSCLPVVH